MLIAIMQPTYMPWLGYFAMIDQVDCFVFLDTVQLEKRSWQVRNKIKENDKEVYLTIPVLKTKSRDELMIRDACMAADDWRKKHFERIKRTYKLSKNYSAVTEWLSKYYDSTTENLSDFTESIIEDICEKIGITTPIIKSSELEKVSGKKDELLVNICNILKADTYLSAQGSAAYIEKTTPGGAFARNGIRLKYQCYEHPKYSQVGQVFIPYVGIYDLLYNCGFEQALGIIRSGEKQNIDYKEFREMNGW